MRLRGFDGCRSVLQLCVEGRTARTRTQSSGSGPFPALHPCGLSSRAARSSVSPLSPVSLLRCCSPSLRVAQQRADGRDTRERRRGFQGVKIQKERKKKDASWTQGGFCLLARDDGAVVADGGGAGGRRGFRGAFPVRGRGW
jgi:hypothetical protein